MTLANKLKQEASELASQRASSFQPEIEGAFQCPRCWIDAGRKLQIVPIPSKADGALNTYHCFGCDYKITG